MTNIKIDVVGKVVTQSSIASDELEFAGNLRGMAHKQSKIHTKLDGINTYIAKTKA